MFLKVFCQVYRIKNNENRFLQIHISGRSSIWEGFTCGWFTPEFVRRVVHGTKTQQADPCLRSCGQRAHWVIRLWNTLWWQEKIRWLLRGNAWWADTWVSSVNYGVFHFVLKLPFLLFLQYQKQQFYFCIYPLLIPLPSEFGSKRFWKVKWK